ncbi:MAG: hypothetical protein PHD37_00365 [Gallionellaceae bacterium]|nr:hypothetical protein [Gallionellaceae bacterium]
MIGLLRKMYTESMYDHGAGDCAPVVALTHDEETAEPVQLGWLRRPNSGYITVNISKATKKHPFIPALDHPIQVRE